MKLVGMANPRKRWKSQRGGEIQISNQYNHILSSAPRRLSFILSGLFISSYAKIIYVLRLVYSLRAQFLDTKEIYNRGLPTGHSLISPRHPILKTNIISSWYVCNLGWVDSNRRIRVSDTCTYSTWKMKNNHPDPMYPGNSRNLIKKEIKNNLEFETESPWSY